MFQRSAIISATGVACAVIASYIVSTTGIIVTFISTKFIFVDIIAVNSITGISLVASASKSPDFVFTGGIVITVIGISCTFINISAVKSVSFETIIAEKPLLQAQVKLSSVLMQDASAWQLMSPVSHSLISKHSSRPSPEYPVLQSHVKPPSVLVKNALSTQTWSNRWRPFSHSLWSVQVNPSPDYP